MAIDLLMEHPQYPDRMRQYRLDLAEAAGDDLKTAQVNMQFEIDKGKLMSEAYVARDTKRDLDFAKTTAASKYPDVDPELYADATTAADVERVAAKMQAAITAKLGNQQPEGGVLGEGGGATWGGPPAVGAAGAPNGAKPPTREEEMDALRPYLGKGIKARAEVKRYAQLAAAPWLDILEKQALENRPQTRANSQ